MYSIDRKDAVVPLAGVPQCSVGAPCPIVVADEFKVTVAYYLQDTPDDWDGTSVRVVGPSTAGEPAAVVSFEGCLSTMFGMPNDEAFSGHPLASRGLKPYSACEVRDSSWVRQLDKMNSVHPQHRRGSFTEDYRHFILAFHDTTFECVARRFSVSLGQGPLAGLAAEVARALGDDD